MSLVIRFYEEEDNDSYDIIMAIILAVVIVPFIRELGWCDYANAKKKREKQKGKKQNDDEGKVKNMMLTEILSFIQE